MGQGTRKSVFWIIQTGQIQEGWAKYRSAKQPDKMINLMILTSQQQHCPPQWLDVMTAKPTKSALPIIKQKFD